LISSFRELCGQIHERPGIYGLERRYSQAVLFISGADALTQGALLAGLTEWLTIRHGRRSSMAWPGFVLEEALGDTPTLDGAGHLADHDEEVAFEVLFDLLEGFFAARLETEGLQRIIRGVAGLGIASDAHPCTPDLDVTWGRAASRERSVSLKN
jgi:hypothetical protein